MHKKKVVLFILIIVFLLLVFVVPFKKAFTFTEHRTEQTNLYFVSLEDSTEFQIRYVHSIHLSDVIETYEVTNEMKIRLVSMTYENLGIGLPGYAAEGESISLKNGQYTLTYDDKVIDSFTLLIGNVDADLSFRYESSEIDLKENLEKGKSYTFCVKKLSFYQMLKGVNIDVKRNR